MRIQFSHGYKDIISTENLLLAWKEFTCGKKSKLDVQQFSLRLMNNILQLNQDLASKTYVHGPYKAFNISDPKPRNIHKASVRDRLLHHALHRILYPFFDRTFISDSYSCRNGKGIHKALNRFESFSNKISKNYTKTAWVLKCDIRKFFATIDQVKLLEIIQSYIPDKDITNLLSRIVSSFQSTEKGVGLPLGNLTSQLLVNIYMNEFDQYVKHTLKQKYYIRYADDFILLHHDRFSLLKLLPEINCFLIENLKLSLHPDKVFIKTFSSGVDFLGWVHFPNHRILRTSTKKRMLRNLRNSPSSETEASYRGMLKHGNTHKLQQKIFRYDTLHPL